MNVPKSYILGAANFIIGMIALTGLIFLGNFYQYRHAQRSSENAGRSPAAYQYHLDECSSELRSKLYTLIDKKFLQTWHPDEAERIQVTLLALKKIRMQSQIMSNWHVEDFVDSGIGRDVSARVEETYVETGGNIVQCCRCLASQLGLSVKTLCAHSVLSSKKIIAKPIQTGRDIFRSLMNHAGELFRKYISGREKDAYNTRFSVVEDLHKNGRFKGSFGHNVFDGMVEIMSGTVYPAETVQEIRRQTKAFGRDLVLPDGSVVPIKKPEVSSMIGISGMSFPQLSAQSHLSLLFIHLKLATDERNIRQLLNTGEGGPNFHIALLEGNRIKLRNEVLQWARMTEQFPEKGFEEAKLVALIDQLMTKRDELFAEFTDQDLLKAQIVPQFGPSLNGVRNSEGRIDFDKLKEIGESPYVAAIQFKVKQAAKRGSKVDPSKVDHMTAAMRRIDRRHPPETPLINPELDSFESIATTILATKMVTKKPVSIKMGIGNVSDFFELIEYLKLAGALPDHIQVDGRGLHISPGSGNAPPFGNTSLPLNDAILVADATLKKLGVRDDVFIEASGDVLLPAEGVEKLALGADGISAARLWMAQGLGCAKVRQCANGNCPYGIAAKTDSIAGNLLNPLETGPKGFEAAHAWFNAYTTTIGETGTNDWREFRVTHGLASRNRVNIRKIRNDEALGLGRYYNIDYLRDKLDSILTDEEIRQFVLPE